MKTLSLILCAVLAVAAQLRAHDARMDEITLILWRKQTYLMTHEDKLGMRLAQLMEVLGKETAAYSPEQMAALKLDKFEDRLRLIALARVQHPELFEEIYKIYVKYPSKEEIDKRWESAFQSYSSKLSEDEMKMLRENVAKMRSYPVMRNALVEPPSEIQPKHLEGLYPFCFEYFWMSPHLEPTNCERPLQIALNQCKKKSGSVDMRALIEERLRTFEPTLDPNFQREDQ